jgi:endonuclease/exonuclease/phosphatase family metal-dependent hydrolase
MRIASYNIQKCIGLDLRRKPSRTLSVLNALQADMVALQEADKRIPPRPAALPAFLLEEEGWHVAPLGAAGSLGWHGNAVIHRASVRIMRTRHIPLPGLEPRGAVAVEADGPIGPVRLLGLHLGLVTRWRLLQIAAVERALGTLEPMPTVWAGDFNDWSRGDRIARAMPAMPLPALPSFPAPRPVASLDRIAISGELACLDHGVHTARPAASASDHLPIWADLARANSRKGAEFS